jgi:hypothetical protein
MAQLVPQSDDARELRVEARVFAVEFQKENGRLGVDDVLEKARIGRGRAGRRRALP